MSLRLYSLTFAPTWSKVKTVLVVFFVGLSLNAAQATSDAEIVVKVDGLKDSSGQVLISLWNTEGAWLDSKRAFRWDKIAIQDGRARVAFANIPAGTYAVCATHDSNKNAELDTNFLGIPAEGVGCSRDAKARFGPPKWKDAAFTYNKGSHSLPIKINY